MAGSRNVEGLDVILHVIWIEVVDGYRLASFGRQIRQHLLFRAANHEVAQVFFNVLNAVVLLITERFCRFGIEQAQQGCRFVLIVA
ncbi:hypothetical protein D3C78_761370 [compost metagenome]